VKKLTIDELERKLAAIPEDEPDEWDVKLLEEIDAAPDDEYTSLEEVMAIRECSGKISLRVPRELHYHLLKKARSNGVSLNQFIVYKLAK